MAIDPEKEAYREWFTARLQKLRSTKYRSAAAFAKTVGIKPESYAKYEGRSLPPHHHLVRIADGLGISVHELLTDAPPKQIPGLPPGTAEIVEATKSLDSTQRQIVLDLVESLKKQAKITTDGNCVDAKHCYSYVHDIPMTRDMFVSDEAYQRYESHIMREQEIRRELDKKPLKE